MAAYPITPQTSVVEEIATMVEDGTLDCRFLPVEGEHSAMAACAGASAAGARVFTATSSQGLLYMHEVLHMASGGRLPIVMANANRAVFAPWTIWADHNDSLAQRDTGWLQYYCASVQEVYNTVLQAFKVAEEIKLPVMVNFDGFILSHSMVPIRLPEQADIDAFLPEYEPTWRLDPQNPSSFGNVTMPPEYAEFRKTLARDILASIDLVKKAAENYKEYTGMWDGDVFEPYLIEDAEVVVLSMGSMASEVEISVDHLRKQGIKAGALRLRLYRPFPAEDLRKILPKNTTLITLDRNYSFGMEGGVLFNDCKAALYDKRNDVRVLNQTIGIGGLDLTWQAMAQAILALLEA